MIWLARIALILIVSLPAHAEQSIAWKDYVIHYTTFSSTLIPPEVAAANDIVRAENKIVTNIVVRKDDKSVRAQIDGRVSNLLERIVELNFREVTEQDAVYYLASHMVNEEETLRFDVDIKPEGETESYRLEFTRTWN